MKRNVEPPTTTKCTLTRISPSSSIAESVTSCDITRCATCELIYWPMKIIRFPNSTVARSRGPPGVMIAGIKGGFSFADATIVFCLQIIIYNVIGALQYTGWRNQASYTQPKWKIDKINNHNFKYITSDKIDRLSSHPTVQKHQVLQLAVLYV